MRYNEFFDQQTDEMIGVKKYHHLTAEQLMKQVAKDYNLTVLGNGAFGHVLSTNNPDVVVKVFEQDDAYLSFVKYIQEHPNKHFPKIVSNPRLMTAFYKRYAFQSDQFVVLTIERLQELPKTIAAFVEEVANADDLHDAPIYLPDGSTNGGDSWTADDDYDPEPSWTYLELSRDYPWIRSLWEAAKSMFQSKLVKGNRDLHLGNLMMRKDGTIVITDPVSDPEALSRISKIRDIKNGIEQAPPMIKGPYYQPKNVDNSGNLTNDVIKELDSVMNKLKKIDSTIELLLKKKSLTASEQQHLTALHHGQNEIDRTYGAILPAYKELQQLMQVQNPTLEQSARKRRLVTVIDQKLKILK